MRDEKNNMLSLYIKTYAYLTYIASPLFGACRRMFISPMFAATVIFLEAVIYWLPW